MSVISKIIHFLTTDIWRFRLKHLPRTKSFAIKQLRIVILAFRGFAEDKCQLRASALTYYSLLSIVPVAAMAFGIAKGFGFEKMLQKHLLERIPGQEEVLNQVISFAQSLLENTKGGIIAGIGVAVLFWTVIKVLGNIERSFNDIWGIKIPRSMGRKFSDYLSIMLICPILVIMASSATVCIATQITHLTERFALLGMIGPVIFVILKLLPYCVLWILFTFIYIFMPNGKVNFSSGLFAGIIAGTMYQIVQWIYINFQVGVAKYNAIYGSFAALPLFLVWLQLSWLIVLFGAEISFARQNVDTYEFEPDCLRVSHSFKRLISLYIVHAMVKNFSQGKKPLTAEEISHELEIPIRLVRQVIFELEKSGIVDEVKTSEYKEHAYQPARDINLFTVEYVIDAIESAGTDNVPIAETESFKAILNILEEFKQKIQAFPENQLLKNI